MSEKMVTFTVTAWRPPGMTEDEVCERLRDGFRDAMTDQFPVATSGEEEPAPFIWLRVAKVTPRLEIHSPEANPQQPSWPSPSSATT